MPVDAHAAACYTFSGQQCENAMIMLELTTPPPLGVTYSDREGFSCEETMSRLQNFQ